MKKIFIWTTVLALMLALCSCTVEQSGGKEPPDDDQQVDVNPGDQNQDKDQDDGEAPDDGGQDNDEPADSGEITFESLTVIDNDQCSVTIKEIEESSIWGYTLKAVLENKSADKTYMFSVESASVNGVECDPFFATEVAAGKKANGDITFSDSDFRGNDIGEYTVIELSFRIYDSNDWSADPVARETVVIYPMGEDKATRFERQPADTDQVLADNDNVSITAVGYTEDSIWGYTVELYIVNKTDKTVMFTVEEASVNGFMADPFFATSVGPGRSSFAGVSWSSSTLEDIDAETVENIEMKLRAYDYNNILSGNLVEQTVTLEP